MTEYRKPTPEMLEDLRKHKLFLEHQEGGKRLNYSGKILSRYDLRGARLENADLKGADLSFANLRGARLENADLSDADLSGAVLNDANLKNAILYRADLSYADFANATFTGCIGLPYLVNPKEIKND